MSTPAGFTPFAPYEARWRYSDPDLGGVSMPVTVRGRPNSRGDVLCSVGNTRMSGSRLRCTDLMIPLHEIAATDDDCNAVLP